MTRLGIFSWTALLVGLVGCASQPSVVQSVQSNDLSFDLVGNWSIVTVDSKSVTPASAVILFRPDGQYVARVSCNSAVGTYSRVDGQIVVIGSRNTERGCDPPVASDDAVLAALGQRNVVVPRSERTIELMGRNRLSLSRIR